jgi:hypothetical protein
LVGFPKKKQAKKESGSTKEVAGDEEVRNGAADIGNGS